MIEQVTFATFFQKLIECVDDEQFNDEKAFLIRQIQDMPPLDRH